MVSETPDPPYYACIFTSQRNNKDEDGYAATAQAMLSLARQQKGFLGIESIRNTDGSGITVSYWASLESIQQWKQNADHQIAQQHGKEKWYDSYKTRICKVERA